MRSPDEILAMPIDPNANYLGDRLMEMGMLFAICGASSIGKSRLLLQLLVCLITGRLWLGMETRAKDFSAVVIQTENGIDRLRYELGAMKRWLGNDWPLVSERLRIHTLETDIDPLVYLEDPENALRVEKAITEANCTAAAFDPLRDLTVGDLNKDVDMNAVLRGIYRVTRKSRPDRTPIVLHHALTGRTGAAKAFGMERGSFARNSKVLHSHTRGMINVVPGEEDNNDTLILTCGKNSNGREFEPFAVKLNLDYMIYELDPDFDVEGYRESVTGKPRQTFSPKIVAEIPWPQSELEKKTLAKQVMDETGCAKSRAYSLIDDAVKDRFLTFKKLTRTYVKK
jgi:hypothetical protein